MNEDKRDTILSLIENRNIKRENIPRVLDEVGITPSSGAWYRFIDQLMLWFGALSLVFAMMFFMAYNWSLMENWGKFILVELSIVLSLGGYLYLDEESLSSKVMLFVSSILVGVLLALFGQTYQTGADTWQLFFYWAVLILPWIVVGRFSALWIFGILLINLSIFLYMKTFGGFFGFYFYSDYSMLWVFFLFNTMALALWEFFRDRFEWLNTLWAVRLLGVLSEVSITWLALASIWDRDSSLLAMLILSLWLFGVYSIYRVKKIDLFMLSIASFSFSIVVVNIFIKIIPFRYFGLFSILFVGLVVVGLGGGLSSWLKSLHKELEDE